jgi:hypothetical protein
MQPKRKSTSVETVPLKHGLPELAFNSGTFRNRLSLPAKDVLALECIFVR